MNANFMTAAVYFSNQLRERLRDGTEDEESSFRAAMGQDFQKLLRLSNDPISLWHFSPKSIAHSNTDAVFDVN